MSFCTKVSKSLNESPPFCRTGVEIEFHSPRELRISYTERGNVLLELSYGGGDNEPPSQTVSLTFPRETFYEIVDMAPQVILSLASKKAEPEGEKSTFNGVPYDRLGS